MKNAGILGFVLVAGYGLYKFKNHKGRSSLYLIQLRLAAQGTAVGIIGVGVLYKIYNESIKPKFKNWKNHVKYLLVLSVGHLVLYLVIM